MPLSRPPLSIKTGKIARQVNHFLDKMIPVITPLAIALGFLLPGFFIHLRPYVIWLFAMMTFSGALKLKAREFGAAMRSPLPIFLFFAVSHIMMPLAAKFATAVFFENTDILTGFVLLFSGPTAVSGLIWVSIFKGDKALCLTLILLDTLLAPLVVPGTVLLLMGAKTTMDMNGIALSLLFMVVIPTIIGVTINEASREKIPVLVCPYVDPFAKICLMLVIAANAAAVALPDADGKRSVQFNDPLVWKVAVCCILFTVTGFLIVKLAAVICKIRHPNDTTVVFCTGLRNNSAVMTIAVTFFPGAAVLPALLSIVFQQIIAAIMGKALFKKTDAREDAANPS